MPSEGPETPRQQPAERGDASDKDSIVDIDAAREAAFAEKPARDYIAEYKDQLSDEARQNLEWIASQEAEKALRRYEETKDEDDPVVRVLRERALESIEFPQEVRERFVTAAKEGAVFIGDVPPEQWIAGCEWALRDLGAELIDATISDGYKDLPQKKRNLERLGPGLQAGIEYASRGGTLKAEDRGTAEVGWGVFIGNLMAGKGIGTIEFLREMVNPRVLEQTMGFLTRARISHPEVAKSLDQDLSGRGWLWDKRQNKYIGMP